MGEWMYRPELEVSGNPHAPAALPHWIGGWVDSGAGLDDMEKLKKFFTLPGLELRPLGRPARSQTLYRQVLWFATWKS
jgi:hypothetical protein